MKEDSIEDDIKNAEHFIDSIKTDKEYKEENGWHGYYNKEIVELARISEHILSDYKRVLKENEELKSNKSIVEKILDKGKGFTLQQTQYIWEHYIPIQKIKDKIEEIQKDKDSKYYDMFLETRDIEYLVKILQELLEGEE